DDVSSTYVDAAILAAERGPKAVELAYRGEEKNSQPYPGEFATRGGVKFKDWYYFSGITMSIGLNTNRGDGFSRGRRGNMGCPKF
ncbi:MAG: hypothetical protein H7Y27_12525, partial [Gemmatimonadaceae bacterium]|nr:hypothetical protein [Chitinophagaceae bacterium]